MPFLLHVGGLSLSAFDAFCVLDMYRSLCLCDSEPRDGRDLENHPPETGGLHLLGDSISPH